MSQIGGLSDLKSQFGLGDLKSQMDGLANLKSQMDGLSDLKGLMGGLDSSQEQSAKEGGPNILAGIFGTGDDKYL